jgi:hypothetical protein
MKERSTGQQLNDDFAFRHEPRKDGTILLKDGSILTLQDLNPLMKANTNIVKQQHTADRTEIPDEAHRRPQWTSTLLRIQRLQLKIRYKYKTNLRSRIMRQIRRKETNAVTLPNTQRKPATRHVNMRLQGWSEHNEPVYRPELNNSPTTKEGDENEEPQTKPTSFTTTQLQRLCQLTTGQHSQYDITQGFMGEQDTYGKSIMHQCMNALHTEPPKPEKKKGLKLRIKVAVQKTKRRKLNFPTITVPGTPEKEKGTHEVQTQESKKKKGIDDDLDLYYKVYNRYKPEAGESNAESAARSTALEAEYQYLLMKKNTGRENVKRKRQRDTKLHYLSPITQPRETLEFKVKIAFSQDGHSNNNVQEIVREDDIVPRRRLQNSHPMPKEKQQKKVSRKLKTLRPGSLDSIPPALPCLQPSATAPLNTRQTNQQQNTKEVRETQATVGAKQKIRQNPAPNVHNHTSHKRIPPRTTICQPNDTYKHPDRGTTVSPPDSHQAYKTTKGVLKLRPAKNKEHEKHRQNLNTTFLTILKLNVKHVRKPRK